jgi:glycosyltransferase involved in cell wall biosynthesis
LNAAFIPVWKGNPYHWELKAALEKLGVSVSFPDSLKTFYRDFFKNSQKTKILHLHSLPYFEISPVNLVRYFLFYFRLSRLKKNGMRIIWTVHDLHNHDSRYRKIEEFAARNIVRRIDALVVHGETAKQILQQRWGHEIAQRTFIIPHGNYIHSYPNTIDRETARKILGLDSSNLVFLFLGLIRPYKGVPEMVRAFRQIVDTDARLVIAGNPVGTEIADEIHRCIEGDRRITFLPGRVDDEKVQIYMNACDLVVLPYKRVLTSGAAILAMSFSRPCIAPRAGCITDTLDERGAIFFDSEPSDDLLRAMRTVITLRQKLNSMGAYNFQRSLKWDWKEIAGQTAALFESVASKPGAISDN